MRTVMAADLGGTKCRFGLVGADLTVVGAREVATTMDRDELVATIDRELAELRQDVPEGMEPPAAIGIGAAGIVPPHRQTLTRAPNLPLDDYPLGSHLQERHGVPVTILNDGRASAWGEYLRGHAQGRDPLLVLFFGTGIGIGMILDGEPYGGANNAAGEVGHLPYRPGGRECSCKRLGCYEAYCGGGPMTRRAAAEFGSAPGGGKWRVDDIVALEGERPEARAILEDAETAACSLVASLCTTLNPAAVVLGGGVLKAWPYLRKRIESFTRSWCTDAVTSGLVFVPSLGESDAILWGAAKATGGI